jgi:hypothetical protein
MATPAMKTQANVIDLLRVSTDKRDVERQRDDLAETRAQFSLNTLRTVELHGVSGTGP